MGINYNDLNKDEKKDDAPQQEKQSSLGNKISSYLIFLVIVSIVVFLGLVFLGPSAKSFKFPLPSWSKGEPKKAKAAKTAKAAKPQGPKAAQQQLRPSPPPPQVMVKAAQGAANEGKSEDKITFVLTGVFIADGEKCALINNKIVKEGDTLSGARVKSIELDKVELQYAGSTLEIKNSFQ